MLLWCFLFVGFVVEVEDKFFLWWFLCLDFDLGVVLVVIGKVGGGGCEFREFWCKVFFLEFG